MSDPRPIRARTTISWGLLDQIVSSGSTFVFIVIAASSLKASQFGAIAIVFEFYLLGVFVSRGVCGDPLTSRFSGVADIRLRRPVQWAATSALLVGAGLGLLIAASAWLADPPLRNVFLVAAVALPGLTLQDFVRSALIVQGRVRSTFLNDTFWAIAQLPVLWVVISTGSTAPRVFGAWAATGCVAALVGLIQLRCGVVHPRVLIAWLRETKQLWPYYLADNLVYQLTSLLLMVVVAATAGVVAMAGFRVAMTVYAPLSLIGRGVVTVCVSMLARRRSDPTGVRRSAMLISTVLTPLPLGWGVLMLFVPAAAGTALFGESWLEAESLVFLASFVSAAGLFATGVIIGLRALSAGRHTLAGRLAVSVGGSAAAVIGGVLGEERGVFIALAWFFPVQAAVWCWLLRHATRGAEAEIHSGERLDVE